MATFHKLSKKASNCVCVKWKWNRCFAGWTGTTGWRWTTSGPWRRRPRRSWTRRGARGRSGGPRALSRRSPTSIFFNGSPRPLSTNSIYGQTSEDPWKRRVVLPKQSTFKETVVRQGVNYSNNPGKAEEVVTVKQSDRIFMLCQQTNPSRQTVFRIWDICKWGEICKQAEGWLNNCNSLLLLLRWKHRKSTAFGKEGKWVLRKETHRDSVIVSGLLWSLCSIQPNHLL